MFSWLMTIFVMVVGLVSLYAPVDALTLESLLAIVDEPTCTHCEHCIPACPVFALEIKEVDSA